ncbi:hypothetical protein GJU39_09655 [Pedobacter petrophilus]|uniref:Uncharacterized protein n=1 Tax=Pedobacter petrophilus TaxID=1908241 RepID=A0A7K0FZ38_9SPHI|nr:hypothetical protein [Pedobacter petrophilus]MRX76354.1 hypothetical protein [Pedobacter petrophilus]
MFEIEELGGAYIGNGRATWPFAKLMVNKNELRLNASILGNLYFRPADILSIELFSGFLRSGIKIRHRVNGYNQKVIFLSSGSRELITRIANTGFLNNTSPIPADVEAGILQYQSSGSFPMKWPAVIIFVLIWNFLLMGDLLGYFRSTNNYFHLQVGKELALIFAFLFALAILISAPFSRLVLKNGRTVTDIRSFLYFLMAITGFIFTIISLLSR